MESKMKTRKRNKGFTLVEILIVVVILGILAAIVIPQFTQASSEAKLSSLESNLRTMRSQIELYKINNTDTPPGSLLAMTVADANGKTYLRSVPNNPFTGGAVENADGAAGTDDWDYVPATGEVHADDAAHFAL